MSENIAESAERNDDFDDCPFCGGTPTMRKTVEEYPADDQYPAGECETWYHLRCDGCGIELEDEYRDELVSKWNSRAFTVPELIRDYRLVEVLLEKGRVDDALELLQDRINRNGGRDDSQGMVDVLEERRRQIDEEGWTVEHDDQHSEGEIARAAASYALHDSGYPGHAAMQWPWDAKWWKPTDRRRNLVKAGALIVAEIDRLDRVGGQS
jgi:hypothetical protein